MVGQQGDGLKNMHCAPNTLMCPGFRLIPPSACRVLEAIVLYCAARLRTNERPHFTGFFLVNLSWPEAAAVLC